MPKEKTGTHLIQIRMPQPLVDSIDRIISQGLYRSRTEFLMEATRISLARFQPEDQIHNAIFSKKRLLSVKRQPILNSEQRILIQRYLGDKSPEEVMTWTRERD